MTTAGVVGRYGTSVTLARRGVYSFAPESPGTQRRHGKDPGGEGQAVGNSCLLFHF